MQDKQHSWIPVITATTSIAAVFLYFVGWTYLVAYYDFFRIDVYEIEPSVQYVLVNSFQVIRHILTDYLWADPPGAAVLLFVILAVTFLIWHHVTTVDTRSRLFVIMGAAAVLWLISVGYLGAWHAGVSNARHKWMTNSNPILLAGRIAGPMCRSQDSNTLGMGLPIACHSANLALREILTTERFHFVFMREKCDEQRYRTCGGLTFKVAVDGSSYTATLRTGEPR